jgi:outer membrane protein TolC
MKNYSIILIYLIYFVNQTYSQDILSLSLEDVVQKSITNSPNLKKLGLNDQKNVSELSAFNSALKPKVDFETQFGFNPVLPTQRIPDFISGDFTKTIPVQFGTFQNHQATLTASQVLYSKALSAGKLALMKSFELNEFQSNRAKEDLVYNMTKIYFQVQNLKYQTQTVNNSINQLDKLIELSQARESSGLGLAIDTDRLRLNRNNLSAQKEIIASQEQSLVDVINVLTGQPFGTKINFTTQEYNNLDFPTNLNTNELKSSTLDLLDKQKEVIKAQIESTLASNKPTIAGFGTLGGQMLGNGLQDLFKGDRYAYFLTFGVQVKIPIYDGKQSFHKSNSAKIDLLQIDEDKRNYIQGVEQQYLSAYQSYYSNLKQLENQSESVLLAQKIYNLTQDRYAQGITPLIDVIDAQKSLADAENNVQSTKLMIILNKINLTYFKGNILK